MKSCSRACASPDEAGRRAWGGGAILGRRRWWRANRSPMPAGVTATRHARARRRRRVRGSAALSEPRGPIARMSSRVLDRDDFDEVTVEHPKEDLKREIGNQAMTHPELGRNRGQQRPTDRMRDDILNRLVDGERKSLAEAFPFLLVLASGGAELDERGPKNPMRASTGHATESAAARSSARRALHPTASNRARQHRPQQCAA